jgi:hypothetical protein
MALVGVPANAATQPVACPASAVKFIVQVDRHSATTVFTQFAGDHMSPARWTKTLLQWDVPIGSDTYRFSLDSKTYLLTIQPPITVGDSIVDPSCRDGW